MSDDFSEIAQRSLREGKMRGPVAVSAYYVASLPQRFNRPEGEWMQKIKPIAIVGHAYYIFDLR